jgi:hypothetical protein
MSTNFSENGGHTREDGIADHLERELSRRCDETIDAAERTLVDIFQRRGAQWFHQQFKAWEGTTPIPDSDDAALLWSAVEDFREASWSPSQTVIEVGRLLQKQMAHQMNAGHQKGSAA